jgi:hypothetical protein
MEDLYQQDNETDLVNRERELLIYQNENTNILDKISQYKSYKEKINSFISDSFEKINNILKFNLLFLNINYPTKI